MKKVSITVGALVVLGALAASCGNSKDSDRPGSFDDGPDAEGGKDGAAGGSQDDGGIIEDSGIGDATDELVPIDADRGEQDGGDGSVEQDAGGDGAPEPECIFDEHCADKLTLGVCELAKCNDGVCKAVLAPRAFPCDDGIECSSGGLCEEGVCTAGQPDVTNPDCVDGPTKNALWITEIMGRPRAIDDRVDAIEGQWVEVTSRAAKELYLQGIYLVYYEWPEGAPEPTSPSYVGYAMGDRSLPPDESIIVARSFDSSLNGGLRVPFSYGNAIEFRADRNARLMLVAPEWTKGVDLPLGQLPSGPIEDRLIIDSVHIPAGTFGAAHAGRTWQAAMPLPIPSKPTDRTWCYVPAAPAHSYVEEGALSNWGTPGAPNVTCSP